MKQGGRISLCLNALAIAAFSILTTAIATRAQQTIHETNTASPAHSASSSEPGTQFFQILTPTGKANFAQYLEKMRGEIGKHWTVSLPLDAHLKGLKGSSTIRFQINRDGTIQDLSVRASSGNDSLDQASIKAILTSNPLEPLPSKYKGSDILLLDSFVYDIPLSLSDCRAPAGDMTLPPFDRLEFLAFLAGQGRSPYEVQVICRRGIDFTPDAPLLADLRSFGVSPDVIEALASFKPWQEVDPSADRASAFKLLETALAHASLQETDSADQDFVHALQLAPDSATLHLAYGKKLLVAKKYSEAEAQIRLSLKLWPEDADAHTWLAMTLSFQKRDREAVPEARESLRIFPGDMTATAELGISLTRTAQYKEAIPILKQALPATGQLPVINKVLGVSLVHTADFDGAIERLNLFLKTNPNDAESHYFLGVALRGKEKPEEALAQFREAARIEPSNPLYSAVVGTANSKESANTYAAPAGPRPDDCFLSGNVYTNTFFGFSYEFPKGWIVQKAEAGKAAIRLGVSVLASGDPTMRDIAEAFAGTGYDLLYVTKQMTKDISTTVNVIHVTAMDKRYAPNIKSGEEFLNSVADFWKKNGSSVSPIAPPEELTLSGRTFWRLRLDTSYKNVNSHLAEVVTIEKNYILLFVFGTADASQINQLVGTMQSLRFTDTSSLQPPK